MPSCVLDDKVEPIEVAPSFDDDLYVEKNIKKDFRQTRNIFFLSTTFLCPFLCLSTDFSFRVQHEATPSDFYGKREMEGERKEGK